MNLQPLLLDIQHVQRRMAAVQRDIARYGVTLRLADAATLLMLFVFLVGFYVADPFHIASFIAQRFGANGTVELAVYALLLLMAALMAVTIARLKRAHYEHKAKYRYSGSVWKVGIVIMAFTVFAEIYNATGNQQHSQFAKAESSKAFDALARQPPPTVSGHGAADLDQLARLNAELAQRREYLATCKKTCQAQRVRIAELQAEIRTRETAQANAAQQQQQAATSASNAMANQLRQLRNDYLHPMVKALMALGLPASVAMQLIAALVAIAFERMHLSASENLRDCYALLDGLEQHLLNKRKEYASFTGTDYQSSDSTSASAPPDTPRPASPEPLPDLAPATASSASTPPPLFKWQQPPQNRFPGFVDTNDLPTRKKDTVGRAEVRVNTRTDTDDPCITRTEPDYTEHLKRYAMTETATVGEGIGCPWCGIQFTKKTYNHRFCCPAHKDEFWNAVKPERLEAKARKQRGVKG